MNPIQLNDVRCDVPDVKKHHAFRLLPDGDLSLSIDNSTLERFQTCPKSAEFYVIDRRQRPSSAAMSYGSAIHKGMELFYLYGCSDAVWERVMDVVTKHFYAAPVAMGEWRTLEQCLETLRRYRVEYADKEIIQVMEHNGAPFVEQSFNLPLGTIPVDAMVPYPLRLLTGEGDAIVPFHVRNIHVNWTGRIDIAAHFPCDDRPWVVDHKTTSIKGDQFYKQFELSQQTIGYCWALRELLGQVPAGLMLNVIVGRQPTRTGTAVEFDRQRFFYSVEQLEEWHEDILLQCADFCAHMLRGAFPRSRVWCMGKYGQCPYFDVCSIPSGQRADVLASSSYVNVDWDPEK